LPTALFRQISGRAFLAIYREANEINDSKVARYQASTQGNRSRLFFHGQPVHAGNSAKKPKLARERSKGRDFLFRSSSRMPPKGVDKKSARYYHLSVLDHFYHSS
jgi:hypothetical protein